MAKWHKSELLPINVRKLLNFGKVGDFEKTDMQELPKCMLRHKTKKFKLKEGLIWRKK